MPAHTASERRKNKGKSVENKKRGIKTALTKGKKKGASQETLLALLK